MPSFEANPEEDAQAPAAVRLQAGAADFVDAFLARFGTVSADSLDSRAWGAPFYRLVTSPTADEAELLGDITHSDSAGVSGNRLPLAPKGVDATARAAALGGLYWLPGFVARNGLAEDETFDEGLYFALYSDLQAALPVGTGHGHWMACGRNEGRISSWAAWTRQRNTT